MKNAVIRFNGYRSLFDELVGNITSEAWNDPFFLTTRNYKTYDVSENDKDYVIEIELPRLKREQIKITEKDGYLNLYAANDRTVYQKSFYQGDWNAKKADIKLEDGVLSITVPKIPDAEILENVLEIKTSKQLSPIPKVEEKKK